MEYIGISLGWNCYPAMYGVEKGIRKKKTDGYLTCPFDECITNYKGVCLCIDEDFKHFFDPEYLQLIKPSFNIGIKGGPDKKWVECDIDKSITTDHLYIHNTRYNFIFNHESPCTELYKHQSWSGGINHFVDNDFKLFKDRYTARINNFRNYLNNGNIQFIIATYKTNTYELDNILKNKYPQLNYNIQIIEPDFTKSLLKLYFKFENLTDTEIDNEFT
jgi:hypothetical protein